MGDYVTAVTEIDSEFKDTQFTASSLVTDTEVDAVIDEMESKINAVIGKKYAVPVTSALAVPLLRRITKWLVVDTVLEMLNSRGVEIGENQAADFSRDFRKAELWLQQFCDGKIDLTNIDPEIEVSGSVDVSSFASSNGLEATMKKGIDQW